MDLRIENPKKKKGMYISKVVTNNNKEVRLKINLAKFISLQKIPESGDLLKIWLNPSVNENIINIFKKIDEEVLHAIIDNNEIWFENGLSLDKINDFFRPSLNVLNNTILLLNSNTEDSLITYDNNIVDSLNDITFIDTHMNIEVELKGLYFFPKKCGIRWIIRKIIINKENSNENTSDWLDRKTIDEEWENDLHTINNNIDDHCDKLINKINNMRQFKKEINDRFEESKKIDLIDKEWNKILHNLSKKIIKYYDGILV